MTLCMVCKARAETVPDLPPVVRDQFYPPYGMDWGEWCDACGRVAEVSLP